MSENWRRRVLERSAYSYRSNKDIGTAASNGGDVPAFPDDGALLVYDGVCVLCSGAVRFLATRDRAGRIRFTPSQSRLGSALMRHYGLDPAAPETMLTIIDGRALGKLDGVVALLKLLPWPWPLARALTILPIPLADWLYDRVALNRYRLFGRREACIPPDPRWRERVLE